MQSFKSYLHHERAIEDRAHVVICRSLLIDREQLAAIVSCIWCILQWICVCVEYLITRIKCASLECAKMAIIKTLGAISPLEGYDVHRVKTKRKDVLMSRFAVTPCVISTIAKLRYRFWKEPNRTTRISTVAKWEIWFRENHGDFTGSRCAIVRLCD